MTEDVKEIKIEELTDEQKVYLAEEVERWKERVVCTDTIDRAAVVKAANLAFRNSGREEPTQIYYTQSLRMLIRTGALLEIINDVFFPSGEEGDIHHNGKIAQGPYELIATGLLRSSDRQDSPDVQLDMGDYAGGNPLVKFIEQSLAANNHVVSLELATDVLANIMEYIQDEYPDVVQEVEEGLPSMMGEGAHEGTWMKELCFYRDIGYEIDLIDPYKMMAVHGHAWLSWEGMVMFCDRPKRYVFDEDGRLHNPKGPAIEYRDGYAHYYWKDIPINPDWVEGNPPSPEECLAIENAELRAVACEILGWDHIVETLGYEVVDTDPDPEIGQLLIVNIPDSGPEYFLRVRCGTDRQFALLLGPTDENDVKTALDAQRLIWGVSNDEVYAPEVRT